MDKESKLELDTHVEDGIWLLNNAVLRIQNGKICRIDNGDWTKVTHLSK